MKIRFSEYRAGSLVPTDTEQEHSLGLVCQRLKITNNGGDPVAIRFKDSGNDAVALEAGETITTEVETSKFFYVRTSGTAGPSITYFGEGVK